MVRPCLTFGSAFWFCPPARPPAARLLFGCAFGMARITTTQQHFTTRQPARGAFYIGVRLSANRCECSSVACYAWLARCCCGVDGVRVCGMLRVARSLLLRGGWRVALAHSQGFTQGGKEDVFHQLVAAELCDNVWSICMHEGTKSNGTLTIGGVDPRLSANVSCVTYCCHPHPRCAPCLPPGLPACFGWSPGAGLRAHVACLGHHQPPL